MNSGNGVSTTNLSSAAMIDELIGNVTRNGMQETTRIPIDAVSRQLASEGVLSAFAGVVGRRTFLLLENVTDVKIATPGHVYDDPDASKNGIYTREAGGWMFQRAFPDTAVSLSVTSGNAPNNITARTRIGVSPSRIEIFFITPLVTNNSEVTLSINGSVSKPVLNVNGDKLIAGEWSAYRLKLVTEAGNFYQLLQDPDVESLSNETLANTALAKQSALAADAAKADAISARDITVGYASDAVSQGNVPIYSTIDGLVGLEVPAGINSIMLNGRHAAGDGEGGQFIDVDNGSSDVATSGNGTARTWYRVKDLSRQRLTTELFKSTAFNLETAEDIVSLPTPYLMKGLLAKVPGREFRFDSDSHLVDNAISVLKPQGIALDEPGRWVMQPGMFDTSFELTFGSAGSGADFTDLTELLIFCCKLRPEYVYGRGATGRCINVRIKAGTTLVQGICATRGQNLGHIRLLSDDPIVPVNFPTDVWWAYAEYNSVLPLFSTTFDMQGIGYDGVATKHGSFVTFEYLTALPPFAGVINAARHNVFINTDCHGAFRKGRFSGAAGNGIHLEKGCHGTAREAIVSGCGGSGVFLLSGCTIDAHMINASQCNWGLRAEIGSTVGAYGANVSGSKSYGLYALSGANIAAPVADITNSGSYGAVADGGSKIVVNGATYSLAVGAAPNGNFLSTNGSDMSALNIDLTGVVASASNFRVLNGSTLRCTGSTGTTNITPNTITSNGIIIK